jgi:hypothetical protein
MRLKTFLEFDAMVGMGLINSKAMTESDKTRIAKDAMAAASLDVKVAYKDEPHFIDGYIAGATAEHTRAWNAAVNSCIALVGNQPTIDSTRWPEVKRKLESLKIKE